VTSEVDLFSTVDVVLPIGADTGGVIADAVAAPTWLPFSQGAIDFISALSNLLLKDPRFRQHPELVAFGYQMRRKAVEALAPSLPPASAGGLIRGRGLALHFAPSNVDTIFLYSLLLSLLAGNVSIVRLSNKKSDQVDLVIDVMRSLCERPEHAIIRNRMVLIRYPHDQRLTDALTALCDIRVIWGGDAGVNAIRQSPLPYLARDIVFPDRWSMAVIDAAAFLSAPDRSELARLFVNDAYWFSQMACSSPRILVWRGEEAVCATAADSLFREMLKHAQAFAGDLKSIDFVNKRVFEDSAAIDLGANLHPATTNLVSVLEVTLDRMDPNGYDHVGGGIFLNGHILDLRETAKLMHRKLQTVVSYGIPASEWREYLASGEIAGVDRIVPLGSALDFAAVWDGMSLMREFTRETTIGV
jgi:hypothetical protein